MKRYKKNDTEVNINDARLLIIPRKELTLMYDTKRNKMKKLLKS